MDWTLLGSLHPEAWWAVGYAALLLAAAAGLERLAERTHARAQAFHASGFSYHATLNALTCPSGEWLRLTQVDHHRRLARYRAKPDACNRCPLKQSCTDADDGREVTRPFDAWLDSEVAHFHRGMSLLLLLLAAVICVAALLRHPGAGEWLVLGTAIIIVVAVGAALWPGFSRREDRLWP